MTTEGSLPGEPSAGRSLRRVSRSRDDRVIAGVCGGLARSLGLDPLVLRVAAVVLTLAGGTGLFAYLTAWVMLPNEDGGESLADRAVGRRRFDPAEVVAVGAIVLGLVLLVRQSGLWFSDTVVWPAVLAGVGVAIIWRQAGDDERPSLMQVVGRLPRPGTPAFDLRSRRVALARVVVGVLLVVAGVAVFLAVSDAFSAVRQGLLATAVIVAGLALVTGPWWLRLGRELTAERRQRIRSEERAEMAAHLHDSVLQTLALIQRNAGDRQAVVTMARRQERELRGWLYAEGGDGLTDEDTLSGAIARAAAEVEERHGVSVDVVTVGDCRLDEQVGAVVAAAREAMVNAAKWSGAPTVSVYAEARDGEVAVFVRDWGSGFDLASVGPDRHGVRESISARMARHGGRAVVRTAPGDGTEVELTVRRAVG
ncbi:MAG TPA: PspC domain-containing protein [Acidimicrobiales bacterium]|nr:PspC domain-containing protein [Acidimicrobiales bacterium]